MSLQRSLKFLLLDLKTTSFVLRIASIKLDSVEGTQLVTGPGRAMLHCGLYSVEAWSFVSDA